MKKSKKLLSLLLCAFMVLGSVAAGGEGITQALDVFRVKASAETEVIYTYEVNDGKATITGYRGEISGDITIPSTLGGYPVTSFGIVFSGETALTSVTIPDSVTSMVRLKEQSPSLLHYLTKQNPTKQKKLSTRHSEV